MTNLLETHRQRILLERDQQLVLFSAAATGNKKGRMRHLYDAINQTNSFIESLDAIQREMIPVDRPKPHFVISSLFLYESFKKLTVDRYEQLFFITGSEVGPALILDQWAELEHEKRTEMGVTADIRSTHKALIHLEQFGHRLLGHFHSHPTNGPGSTSPSGIDESFQKRLEAAGHQAVMAIFSRDGFIRFLRYDGIPKIEIHGTGVELHDAKTSIYRLAEIDSF